MQLSPEPPTALPQNHNPLSMGALQSRPIPIPIIGGGLAGLTLSRCFQRRGIPSIIYEKASLAPRHDYGINLNTNLFQHMLGHRNPDKSVQTLQGLAVDDTMPLQSSQKNISFDALSGGKMPQSQIRVHRGRLEQLIREGDAMDGNFGGSPDLDMRFEHNLHHLARDPVSKLWKLRFATPNGKDVFIETPYVIDTSGVHSPIRTLLSPTSRPVILPYVVYRGTRSLSLDVYNQIFPTVNGGNTTSTFIIKPSTMLQIRISRYDPRRESVKISYTYSRPAHTGQADPLFNPLRPVAEATLIPPELFPEIESRMPFLSPFAEVFDVSHMANDRIVNWLMRTMLMPHQEVARLGKMGVFILGDAAHATPILDSSGGMLAVASVTSFAAHFAEEGEAGCEKWLDRWYPTWEEASRQGEKHLWDVHHGLTKPDVAWENPNPNLNPVQLSRI